MGRGHVPQYLWRWTSMVMSPNILEVMSFRTSTRVSTRNYVQIPKESGWHWECDFRVHFLTSGFPRMPSTSVSVDRPQKYFNANIMCSFTKKTSASWGRWPPTGALPLDPAGGLVSPRPLVFFYVPPIILWDRRPCQSQHFMYMQYVCIDRLSYCSRRQCLCLPATLTALSLDLCSQSQLRLRYVKHIL